MVVSHIHHRILHSIKVRHSAAPQSPTMFAATGFPLSFPLPAIQEREIDRQDTLTHISSLCLFTPSSPPFPSPFPAPISSSASLNIFGCAPPVAFPPSAAVAFPPPPAPPPPLPSAGLFGPGCSLPSVASELGWDSDGEPALGDGAGLEELP